MDIISGIDKSDELKQSQIIFDKVNCVQNCNNFCVIDFLIAALMTYISGDAVNETVTVNSIMLLMHVTNSNTVITLETVSRSGAKCF